MREATWTIKALNKKDYQIEMELREQNIDICVLQETRRKVKNKQVGKCLLTYGGVSKQERANEEVAIMIGTKYKDEIKENTSDKDGSKQKSCNYNWKICT